MTDYLTTTETSQSYADGNRTITQPHSIFDTIGELAIYRERWLQRCLMYQIRRAYYAGSVYDEHTELLKALGLYSGIRQIFGPLRRAVRVDVAKTPGGWTMPEALPQRHQDAIAQIRRWSQAEATYKRAVLHGAVAGEFGLMVRDDQIARTVQIVALRPDEVVTGTLADGSPFGLIIKPGLVDRAGRFEYAQLITPWSATTYRNGQPHDYDGGGATRANVLGFVPVLLSPFMVGENGIGENTFAGCQELLDRVNDATSQALDVIQRNAEPWIVFSGISEDPQIDPENNAIRLSPSEAKAYTIAPNLVIDQALALIDKVLTEFKQNLPQLILDELKSVNDVAYDTVLTLCMELIDHIGDVRTYVDQAITQAEKWAILAAQQMQIPAFAGIDAEAHGLDPERYVIKPTASQQLELEGKRIGLEQAKRALENPQPAAPGAPQQPDAKKPGSKPGSKPGQAQERDE